MKILLAILAFVLLCCLLNISDERDVTIRKIKAFHGSSIESENGQQIFDIGKKSNTGYIKVIYDAPSEKEQFVTAKEVYTLLVNYYKDVEFHKYKENLNVSK